MSVLQNMPGRVVVLPAYRPSFPWVLQVEMQCSGSSNSAAASGFLALELATPVYMTLACRMRVFHGL